MLVENIGIVWFEIVFFLSLCFGVYFVLITSLWQYTLAIALMYTSTHVLRSRLKKHVSIDKQGVFITGCDTGFGHDLAVRLDDIGFIVFAGCLHPNGAGAGDLHSKTSDSLHVVPLDVGDDKSVLEALKYVQKNLPATGLWAVVNNAGFGMRGDVELCTIKLYQKIINVNLYGTIRVVQAFLPHIRKNKGRIVNVSSVRGRFTLPGGSPYFITKHAIETMSDSLRMEMFKFGVKVSIVEPGTFGFATSILNSEQIKRMRQEVDEMWECASDDCRDTYGRHYFDALINIRRRDEPGTKPVIDAMEDAITSLSPQTRYLVDGKHGFIDRDAWLARLYGLTPTWIADYFLIKFRGHEKMPDPPMD